MVIAAVIAFILLATAITVIAAVGWLGLGLLVLSTSCLYLLVRLLEDRR